MSVPNFMVPAHDAKFKVLLNLRQAQVTSLTEDIGKLKRQLFKTRYILVCLKMSNENLNQDTYSKLGPLLTDICAVRQDAYEKYCGILGMVEVDASTTAFEVFKPPTLTASYVIVTEKVKLLLLEVGKVCTLHIQLLEKILTDYKPPVIVNTLDQEESSE